MTRPISAHGRSTKISCAVVVHGVSRDIIVREYADATDPDGYVLRVVEPAFHGPVDGYDPFAPHYTQHGLNSVRKVAHEDAYANRRFSLLVSKAEKRQGTKRGQKFLRPMNLFQIAVHMYTVGGPDEYNTVPELQKLVRKLAEAFGIQVVPTVESLQS